MGTNFHVGEPGWRESHLKRYIETDGAVGHYMDLTALGAGPEAPALILQTTGRKTGQPRLVGLNYGEADGSYVVVASLGGASSHPAWYLNLIADPQVAFQVGARKFSGLARSASGGRRAQLFAQMATRFPFYLDYQVKTEREIPIVLLEPVSEISALTPAGD